MSTVSLIPTDTYQTPPDAYVWEWLHDDGTFRHYTPEIVNELNSAWDRGEPLYDWVMPNTASAHQHARTDPYMANRNASAIEISIAVRGGSGLSSMGKTIGRVVLF